MTDLAAVASELLPNAAWIGDRGAATARPIAWVRVLRARVPAFDGLDPGDLVLAPPSALAVVAPGASELRELVSALAAVPVSGVLVPSPEAGNGRTDDVAAALRSAGLAGLLVDGMDAPELERSVVGFIVSRGAELERQAALLEGELRRRALDGAGVAGLLATVSAFLGRALVLEARRGEPIVVHAPPEAPAAVADAARYQAAARRRSDADAGIALRVPLPGRPGPAGEILALGTEPVSELARAALPRVASLLALELAREEAVRGAVDRARRSEPMPSAGPPWVVVLARQREPGPEDDAPAARERREQLRRQVRLLAPARRLSLRGDADSIEVRIVAAADGVDGDRLVGAIAEALDRPLGISRPFDNPADRPAAEADARATLDAALALPQPPAIARSDRLAIYRMLGALHKLPDGPALARAVLAPLLDARPDVRRERLATLRALLAHGGVGEAATALGVHRNTVAYRVRAIEAATGWRLADPDLRLALAAAVELVQEDQV
ncbi:MAG TPA: helix-turn-helix domain-containing protein [Candidatus Limnocylindrales bacterium]|nr:helix-turn-helix domain-containing protein [Candidatus Limnocylindrales bacterium]